MVDVITKTTVGSDGEEKTTITIQLTRGDSGTIEIDLTDSETEEAYEIPEGSSVYAQVRSEPNGGTLLFDGTVVTDREESKAYWNIKPSDTKGKEVGSYVYDVELRSADGNTVDTFIRKQKFKILDEVTE